MAVPFICFAGFLFCVAWFFIGLDIYESIFGDVPGEPKIRQLPILFLFGGPGYIVLVLFCGVLRICDKILPKIVEWQNK